MKKLAFAILVAGLIGGYSYWAINRPLDALKPKYISDLKIDTPASNLAWPASQAAVGVLGTDILESHGEQKPVAAASTAKIITCLMALKQKPLSLNEQGPMITITANDVANYNAYVAKDGSVVPVQAGQKISQYQMLQAIMLPSANNLADKLAIWAYGSLEEYANEANKYLTQQLKLTGTHVGSDASGLAPDTTTTARDMLILGKLAMQNEVLAQIASQATAPGVAGAPILKNVNFLLGTDGIIGIKTGNSDEAGGAYVAAAKTTVDGEDKTIVTAVMGAPNLISAMSQSRALIRSAQANFKPVTVIKKGEILGSYKQAWGGEVSAVVDKDFTVNAWQGAPLNAKVSLSSLSQDSKSDQIAGNVQAGRQSASLKLASAPTKPSVWWRLSHPLK